MLDVCAAHMRKLVFKRNKYGKELLIDACDETELNIVADRMLLTFYIIIFLERGQGHYCIDAEEIELEDNMVLFIRPGQINTVSTSTFDTCHFLFFEGDFLDEFFNDKNFIYKFGFFHYPTLPSFLTLEPSVFEKYYALAKEIREEIRLFSPDSKHIIRSLVYYLLVRLNQAYQGQYAEANRIISNGIELSFLKLLQQQVRQQHGVAYYADHLEMSRTQLNRLCQKHFSKPAGQMIREHLIAEIKKALIFGTDNLTEVAYAFNFSAPSHFSRFVKQMTGQSPQAYRAAHSNW